VTPGLAAWAARLTPPSPIGRQLVVISLVDSVGTGLFLSSSALYFTKIVGLSDGQVGLGLGIAGLVAFLATVPVGLLADRLGPRATLVILQLWRAAGFTGYVFVHSVGPYVIVAALIAMADRTSSPVLQALAATGTGGEERTLTMAHIRATRNVGFAAGALLATAALAVGSRDAFACILLGDAASFLISGLILMRCPVPQATGLPTRQAPVLPDRRFAALTGLNGLLVIHMTVLAVGFPLWISQHTRVSTAWVAPLLGLNTVLAAVFQVRTSRGTATLRGAAGASRLAGFALAAACLLLAAASGLPAALALAVLIAAMLAHTTGELYQSSGAWGMAYALAPADRRGAYLAGFNLGVTAQQVLGPPLITAVVIAAGRAGWACLGAALATAGLLACTVARHARPAQDPQPAGATR
jgi:MFS family permease